MLQISIKGAKESDPTPRAGATVARIEPPPTNTS